MGSMVGIRLPSSSGVSGYGWRPLIDLRPGRHRCDRAGPAGHTWIGTALAAGLATGWAGGAEVEGAGVG